MTAIVTPMRGGEVDFDALSALCEQQLAGGIDALVAVGTTGESATLTVDEHIAVVKHVVEVSAGRVPVIGGAGGNSTAEAIELSRANKEAGVDGLLQVVPYYNKPTQEGLYRHFEAITKATALPVILYNVPGRTSCDLLPDTVERLADLEHIVAIKEATGDMRRASDLIERVGDRIAVLSGDDFTTFTLLSLGGRGVVSVVSNAMPDRMARLCHAAAAGEWQAAREAHYSIMPLTRLLFSEPNPSPVKAALEMLGVIGPEIRLPMLPATEPLRERIRACLVDEGML